MTGSGSLPARKLAISQNSIEQIESSDVSNVRQKIYCYVDAGCGDGICRLQGEQFLVGHLKVVLRVMLDDHSSRPSSIAV